MYFYCSKEQIMFNVDIKGHKGYEAIVKWQPERKKGPVVPYHKSDFVGMYKILCYTLKWKKRQLQELLMQNIDNCRLLLFGTSSYLFSFDIYFHYLILATSKCKIKFYFILSYLYHLYSITYPFLLKTPCMDIFKNGYKYIIQNTPFDTLYLKYQYIIRSRILLKKDVGYILGKGQPSKFVRLHGPSYLPV